MDAQGSTILPRDDNNVPITSAIPVVGTTSTNGSGETVVTWDLGSPSSQVCLPAGARGTFDVYASISPDV